MKLNEILQRLAAARLITLSGDKYELAHDTLAKFIAGKRSAEEQAVINWERLVRNKWRASIQSGTPDYLTTAQLAGLLPYQAKLDLNAEERQFLLDSQADSRKKVLAAKRWQQIKVGMALVFFILISIALIFALSNKAAVERELERNQRILAGMYFYSDNFAMCVQKDSTGHLKYGFMDKNGKIRIPHIYDEANPFDDYGFARVKIKEKLFLIDTNNVQYSLAETVLALNENTRALRLSEKDLKEIPKEVFDYKELQILYLRGNDLSAIAPKIQGLSNLKILDLGENNLLELPKELGTLSGLKVLDIRKNQLTNIDAITPLAQLEFLNLSHNNLEAIPAEIQQWQALQLLDLSSNNLQTIPEEMVSLNQLKGLNLYNNPNLAEIPAGLNKPSLLLVLNEGQGEMSKKGEKTKYKNDLTEQKPTEIGGTNTVNETIAEEDFVKPLKDNSLDCSNTFLKNEKTATVHNLVTAAMLLLAHKDFDYSFQFENANNQGVIARIAETRFQAELIKPFKKGDKFLFLAASGEKRSFDFISDYERAIFDGNPGFYNILQLDLKSVKWLAENQISEIRHLDLVEKKELVYLLNASCKKELKELAICFLWELDIAKVKDKKVNANLGSTTTNANTTTQTNTDNKTINSLPKAVDIEMIFVDGGSFVMGCASEQGSDCKTNESPKHRVTLSNYSIGKYEITQAQWKAIMGKNPSRFAGCDNCPVEKVSWDDVQEFIKKLNSQTGKNYRLPTESEWEYATRGGKKSKGYKYSGSNDIAAVAWCASNSEKKTHPVGEKTANELGIHDMTGNVREWCSDWYDAYNSSDQTNPKGVSTGALRVLRDGSCYDDARICRFSFRNGRLPNSPYSDGGFRLAL